MIEPCKGQSFPPRERPAVSRVLCALAANGFGVGCVDKWHVACGGPRKGLRRRRRRCYHRCMLRCDNTTFLASFVAIAPPASLRVTRLPPRQHPVFPACSREVLRFTRLIH